MENRNDDRKKIMKESRMKKLSVGLLVLMLIGMTLFVSCSNEPKSIDEGVGSVKFIGSDSASTSRGLTRTNPKFDAGSMVWMYEAKKTDTSGLKTGETSRKTLVGSDGNITNEVGPFSQGIWEFTLYAYESMTNANADKYAYKGVASNVKITSGSTNSVRVTVDAQQNGTGFIEVASNITLQDANGNSISEHNEKIILTNLANSSLTNEYVNSSDRSFEVSSGAWKVNVIFYDTLNPEIIYGNNVIYVNVYDNLTTKVGGSLDEITASTKFVTDSGVTTAISNPVDMSASSENKLSVESTPAAVQDTQNKTEVTIPVNAISVSEGDKAILSVTPYVAKDADTKFSVQVAQEENDVSAIAGLDITVAINDVLVERFNEAITITTYIAKGIDPNTVQVKYNGEGDQPDPDDVTYDPIYGKLTFTTTHLSEYYVIADAAAINTTSNTAYATLKEAVEGSSASDTILMLKNIANKDYATAATIPLKENVVLDGNGHTIEGNVSVYVNAGGGTVKNVVFKNIHNNSELTAKEKVKYNTNVKIGKKTALYAERLSGKLLVKGCTFDTIDWDAIQITPVAGSDIEIVGNTFKFIKNSDSGITDPIRYIHIESNNYTDFRVLITNNKLLNCAELNQTGIEVYFPTDLSKVNLQGNYIDAPFAVCICKNRWITSNFCPELVLPFSSGPNGEAAFVPVCWAKDGNGNQRFYDDLQTAINANPDTINLTSDVVLSESLTINKGITLDGNNHKITCPGTGCGLTTDFSKNENVILKNCVFDKPANHWANTIVGGITYQNCTFNGGCVYVTPSENNPKITIEGCTFNGAMLTIDFMNTVKGNPSVSIDGTLNAVIKNNTFNIETPFNIKKMHDGVGLAMFIRSDSGFYTNEGSKVQITVEGNTFNNRTGEDSYCAYQIIQTWGGTLAENSTIPAISTINQKNTFDTGAKYSWANYEPWTGWSKSVN